MFYQFKEGDQRKLIQRAIAKSGSEIKLSKLTKIPKGSISSIKLEKRNLSEKYAIELCKFLNISIEDMDYIGLLPSNWGQVKGGRNLIQNKIKEGTLKDTVEVLRKVSSKRMKQWHKFMKENNTKEYYLWQYERFKKVGRGYSFALKNGTKVRNILEKKIGNFLSTLPAHFEYEPYVNIKGKVYFPDFKYNNLIIEVTEWKHPSPDKMKILNRKCEDYRSANYRFCFFIPKPYRKFYKGLHGSIVSTLPDLRDFIDASVA